MPAALTVRVAVVVQRRGVDVHAADLAVAGRGRVDVPHALGHELGVVVRMLAEDEDQPLVPLVLQRHHLLADFVLVQRAADLPRGSSGGTRSSGSRSCTRCRRRAGRTARCGCRRRRA